MTHICAGSGSPRPPGRGRTLLRPRARPVLRLGLRTCLLSRPGLRFAAAPLLRLLLRRRLLADLRLLSGGILFRNLWARHRLRERGQHGVQFGQVARHTSKLIRQ